MLAAGFEYMVCLLEHSSLIRVGGLVALTSPAIDALGCFFPFEKRLKSPSFLTLSITLTSSPGLAERLKRLLKQYLRRASCNLLYFLPVPRPLCSSTALEDKEGLRDVLEEGQQG